MQFLATLVSDEAKADILVSHCPFITLSLSMLTGPENMEGRSPCREKNDSLPIKIPRCDTHFVKFKEEKLMQKLMQLGYFFPGEKQKFRLSQRFWPPTSYIAT